MSIYAADFETTTREDDCRVWAWGIADIEKPEDMIHGNDIAGIMQYMQNNGGVYYFHNLRFDGNFIVYWLFKHGYLHNKSSKKLAIGEFATLISDMGSWYTITIQMYPNKTGTSNKVEIRDSLKLIPMPIDSMPKSFGLKESKLTLDYHEDRSKGHELTEHEIEYLKGDVVILAKSIKFMRENNQIKLTAASNALHDFKGRFNRKEYERLFPAITPDADADIRASYKGGWTYLNPKFKNKRVGCGCVYDVNSMYPWAMKYCLLPYGEPYYFTGEYKPSKNYPLFVISFVAEFKLKPGKYPSIQLKNNPFHAENEYITHSIIPTVLTLTSVDYELFLHNYDVDIQEFMGGYMFKGKVGMFSDYIDYWYNIKTESKKTVNPGMERIAKLMLNSLYGKFGSRMTGFSKIPSYNIELDKVQYTKNKDPEKRKPGYLPVATFITSYCRDKIIRAAEQCGERFIYADTDSVHIEGLEPVPGLDVDNFRLGAFKLEEEFKRAKFIRQKTYLEIYEKAGKEKMNLKCCGMPEKMKESVTEDDFFEGAIFDHAVNPQFKPKLMPKVVPGGVILKETTFQIKKYSTQDQLSIVHNGKLILPFEEKGEQQYV